MLPFLNEQGYKEHMAIACRSMFPYLNKAPHLQGDTEETSLTMEQVQSSDTGPDLSQDLDRCWLPKPGQIWVSDIGNYSPKDQENESISSEHQHIPRQCAVKVIGYDDSLVFVRPVGTCSPLAACKLYVEAELSRQDPPHARDKRCRSLPPNVDRILPMIQQSRNTSNLAVWASKKRHTADGEQEEEARLLGVYGSHDAEAVPIGKPTDRFMPISVPVKIPSGGPRPTNTLNNGLTSHANIIQPARRKLRGRDLNQLQFETSRGSNVRPMPHATSHDEGETFAVSLPKRQKISHQSYSSSPGSARSADDILDGLDPATVTFGPSQASERFNQAISINSFNSQSPVPQTQRKASLSGNREYRYVEKLMDSTPASKKRQKFRTGIQNEQLNHGLPSSSPVSSLSNLIDISGIDDEESLDNKSHGAHHPSGQGPAGKPVAATEEPKSISSKTAQGRSTGKISPFFNEPSLPPFKANGTRNQEKARQDTRIDIDKRSDRLNDQFRPIDGDPRTSGVSMSSDIDELQSVGNTVGNNPDLDFSSLTKRSRRDSPSECPTKISQAISTDEEESGMGRSNIRQSNFQPAKPEAQNDTRTMGRLREKKSPWFVELAAVSLSGSLVSDGNIALVHDEKSASYVVRRDGVLTSLRIQPQKLLRIHWEGSGRKVRFMSSKSGTDDNVLDLEFRKEKDVHQLLKRVDVQAGSKVESRDSDYMEKIFEKRRSDFRKTELSTPAALMDRYTVLPTGSSGPRQEIHDLHILANSIALSSSHRPRNSIVDDLYDKAKSRDGVAAGRRDIKKLRNGMPLERDFGQRFEDLKPNHNRHLKRTTRASTQSKKPSNDFLEGHEDYEELPQDVPQAERYSKIHGLGEPWKKPLTYPTIGKKKTTVEFSDLERLDEGEYLNDSLISFYLRFLEHKIEEQRPDLAKRLYFFNTFFFATLMSTHKGRKGFNYEGVQKWTRNVDLFTYDYIVVPINEAAHWYLAIICNLPALDRGLDPSNEEPGLPIEPAADNIGRLEEEGSPSSSPTIDLPEGDSVTLIEEPTEPDEKGARDSFAEMSLEVGAKQPTIAGQNEDQQSEAIGSADEDQELLDGRLYVEERERKAGELPDQPPKVAMKSKKGKRKSMPPVTRLDPSKPAIITFDSLGTSRSPTIRILKDYLREEALAKRGGMKFDPGQIKGITASMIPTQENHYDCGVFLLGYVAKFLDDDPKEFITKVIRRQYDEQKDWPMLKANRLRDLIRKQVLNLHNEQIVERRKEVGAQKSESIEEKPKQDAEIYSSHIDNQAGMTRQESRDDRETVHRPTEQLKEPPPPTRPATNDNASKSGLSLPKYDVDGDVQAIAQKHEDRLFTEASLQGLERAIEERQGRPNPPSPIAAGQDRNADIVSASLVDDPSLIVIESQSQEEAPRSFYHPRSKGVVHGLPDEQPELPAEIQDSQPSQTSRLVADAYRRASDAVEARPKKRDLQEIKVVITESPKESKRRKVGHEGMAKSTQREGRGIHAPRATRDQYYELPEWAEPTSERSLRQKVYGKAGKGNEIISIDD